MVPCVGNTPGSLGQEDHSLSPAWATEPLPQSKKCKGAEGRSSVVGGLLSMAETLHSFPSMRRRESWRTVSAHIRSPCHTL